MPNDVTQDVPSSPRNKSFPFAIKTFGFILTIIVLLSFVPRDLVAQTVTTTTTGTLFDGFDETGLFGFAPGTDMTGQAYKIIVTIDTTKGTGPTLNPSISSSTIMESGASNPATAVVQINGHSASFATLADGNYGSTIRTYGPPTWYSEFQDDISSGAGGDASDLHIDMLPTNTNVLLNGTFETALPMTAIDNSTPSGYFIYHEADYVGSADADFITDTTQVSGLQAIPPGSKSNGANGNASCGCLAANAANPEVPAGGQIQSGDPIALGTGNMYQSVTDYSTVGPNPLAFIRSYNSFGNAPGINSYAVTLGVNWRSNYDRYLHILNSTMVAAERPDGQMLPFTLSGGVWTSDSDVDVTLTQSGTTWTLKDHNETVETYTQTGSEGLLQSIVLRNGYTQTMSYSSGLLSTVTDSYGRTLNFSYSGGMLDTVTTPDTLVLTYGFTAVTAGEQLTSVSYNTSPVTDQTYVYGDGAFPFAITGIVDENGNTYASFTYDAIGRATSSQIGSGANLTNFAYNDTTGNVTVINAFGVADTYKFTMLQGVKKVNEIDRAATATTAAATETFGYDSNGYLNSKVDWNGNHTTYVNNTHGQPTTINEGVGSTVARMTTISYDPTWVHEPHQIITSGLTSTFVYDTHGNPLTRTDTDTTTNVIPYSTNGQTRTTTWTWSGTGQETSIQLPRTDVTAKTTFGYTSGTLTSITDALSHVTNITSSTSGGRPLTVVDPNSVTTTLTYDARLNLATSTLHTGAGNLVTTWTWDAANELHTLELADGSTLTYAYDTAHRLTSATDIPGDNVLYTLDALGDITQVQSRNFLGTLRFQRNDAYDALGRLLTDTNGVSKVTTYTWDAVGNNLTVAPPTPSGTVTFTYDALNRLVTRADPSPGGTTTLSYDAHDRTLSVQDPNSHTTSYVYDGFGDRTQTASPDSGTSVFYYDPDSNITQSNLPGSMTANMTYDALDRILTTAYPSDSSLNVSRTYDQTGGTYGFGVGRLTSATDQAGSLANSFDERGNVTAESRVITGAGTLATATTYDAVSNVAGITYPSGTGIQYIRDNTGKVTSVKAKPPGAGSFSTIVSNIGYRVPVSASSWVWGPASGMAFANGITGTYEFDLAYRPTTHIDKVTGGTTFEQLIYSYFNNGSVQTLTDSVNAANTQVMTYDAMDRMLTATSGTGGYGAYVWTWNATHNIATQKINGLTTTYSLTSGTNKLASWVTSGTTTTVASTAAGNINTLTVSGTPTETLAYSQANRMASATTISTSATYKYDLFGRRLEKAVSGSYPVVYQYSVNGGELLAENDLHSGQTADYIYLDPGRSSLPIAEITPTTGSVYYFHVDKNGTPQKVTDSSKTVVWSATYKPFGDTVAFTGTLTTQSLRLPGQYFDPESGNNHNGFRDYMPGTTRYAEVDLIGLAGGINPYQYSGNNSFKWVDPFGLLDLNYFSPADPLRKAASFYNPPGVFSVAGHGGFFKMIGPDGEPIKPDELAATIRNNTNYHPGESVVLVSCSTGGGPDPFASELSKLLGAPVIAPTTDVDFDYPIDAGKNATGITSITPEPPGQWISFPSNQISSLPPGF